MESEPMLTPREKSHLREKNFFRRGPNPRCCKKQDSKPNTLPMSCSGPWMIFYACLWTVDQSLVVREIRSIDYRQLRYSSGWLLLLAVNRVYFHFSQKDIRLFCFLGFFFFWLVAKHPSSLQCYYWLVEVNQVYFWSISEKYQIVWGFFCFLGGDWLLSVWAVCKVYLRDGSAEAIVLAAILR